MIKKFLYIVLTLLSCLSEGMASSHKIRPLELDDYSPSDNYSSFHSNAISEQRTRYSNSTYHPEHPNFFYPSEQNSSPVDDFYEAAPFPFPVLLKLTSPDFFSRCLSRGNKVTQMNWQDFNTLVNQGQLTLPSASLSGQSPPKKQESFSLTTSFPEWKNYISDQLHLGTCASFAALNALQFVHGTLAPSAEFPRRLSQPYLISVAAKTQGCFNTDLTLGAAMETTYKIGSIASDFWPYEAYHEAVRLSAPPSPSLFEITNIRIEAPFPSSREEAYVRFRFREIKNIFLCPQIKFHPHKAFSIKGALKKYKVPIVVALPVQSHIEKGWRHTGNLSSYEPTAAIEGYHAVTVVGYHQSENYFDFMNSWGQAWGNKGCGTVSYHFINQAAMEAWVGIGADLTAGKAYLN